MKSIIGEEGRKEIKKTEKIYSERKEKNAVLVLENKLEVLRNKVDEHKEIDEIYEEIATTGNKKAKKVIGRESDKRKVEAGKIYEKAVNSKEMQKVECIRGNKYALFIEKSDNGFNMGGIDDKIFGEDAYKEVFKAAFYNERFRKVVRPEKVQIEPMGYVKNEMEEIEDVQKYWGAEEFQNYIKGLEETNPKDAQKYKKHKLKR